MSKYHVVASLKVGVHNNTMTASENEVSLKTKWKNFGNMS